MAQNVHSAKSPPLSAKIGAWLSRRIYPYYVPSGVRSTLQRLLESDLAVLRARAGAYDARTWAYLSGLLEREDPITDFDSLIEILEFELTIAGVGFPARTTASGIVRCGRGWGGYVRVERLGRYLGETDAWREGGVRQRAQSNADAVIDAFVAVIVATGDAARAEAFDVVANLEARTQRVADTVTKARAILKDVAAREIGSQSAFDDARLGRSDVEADTGVEALDAELADVRRRSTSVRATIHDALASLTALQAASSRLLDDAAVKEEWRRVDAEAATAGLPLDEIKRRLETLRPWQLTAWQEHPDKRELFQRVNRQLVIARQLGTADRVP